MEGQLCFLRSKTGLFVTRETFGEHIKAIERVTEAKISRFLLVIRWTRFLGVTNNRKPRQGGGIVRMDGSSPPSLSNKREPTESVHIGNQINPN